MKSFKILPILGLSFGLVFSSTASAAIKPVERYDISDVGPNHRFYDSIERFVYSDIVDGYVESETIEEDGEIYEYSYISIRPEEKINRAQFTKILVSALSLKTGTNVKEFPDVKASKWYYEPVRIASSHGIVAGGSNGKFNPDAHITRDQMAAMIYRAFSSTVAFKAPTKTFKDVPPTNFAYEAIVKSAANGIIQGYGDTFKPHDLATRGQAIAMIDRALHQEAGSEADQTAIKTAVNRNVQEEMRLMKEQNTAGLKALYQDTATGYYLSESLDTVELPGDIEDLGGTFTIEQIGTHEINPVTVNKRFAKVRMDNLKYKVSFSSPDLSFSMNVDASGTAYLKKGMDGKWKIYNLVLDNEDIQDDWEAEISAAANAS
ncbi:S-layer homology domain-containing protein [Bacillus sp. PK3_68]|uniref:S-layer homology domain-containing protein n=1 Tax=Bacillus sp. PK3_68 TaxID=2027408 RepID=UPI000E76EE74|nr:S-layer homology domain-containing protein [Bacillus sp. PK3_68]RJS59417.1 hypothetical protein CJ483_04610 [Bacillus sp. PK3_68]